MYSASVVARPRCRSWVDMFHVKHCFAYGCICNYYICNLFTVYHPRICVLVIYSFGRWLGITTVILLLFEKYRLRFSWMGSGGFDDGRWVSVATERGLRPTPPLGRGAFCGCIGRTGASAFSPARTSPSPPALFR